MQGRHEDNTAELSLPGHVQGTTLHTGLTQGQGPPGLTPVHPQLPPHTQLK